MKKLITSTTWRKTVLSLFLAAALFFQDAGAAFGEMRPEEALPKYHSDMLSSEQPILTEETDISFDETFDETTAAATEDAEAEEASVSLSYVSNITIDTTGSVVRLYGSEFQTYQVPIKIQTDCTLILDHIKNDAALTVANGTNVTLRIRGSNSIKNIQAEGGTATKLSIIGDSADAMLTADNIACPAGGSTAAGAEVLIENCSLACKELGCGAAGADKKYHSGSGVYVAEASPGSSASPKITIRSASVFVTGSIACGGNGVSSTGTYSAKASAGGTAGEIFIANSQVTVGGNMAIGGKGGEGGLNSTFYNALAGTTQTSCPVTIQEHSRVTVTGNVSTQQTLPKNSNGGTQRGLHGVQVTVSDSELTAADIASGGGGHDLIRYNISAGAGSKYDVAGTAGGNGGTIVAENAVITCETAVCGGNAGQYQNYEMSMYGTYTGDYDCVYHPADGNGGRIVSKNSDWNIHQKAGEKGSRWKNYANPSVYGDHSFSGGALQGIVYGAVIAVDLTAILSGGFQAATEFRNSEEASSAKCVLKTSEALAGERVQIKANDLNATTVLDENGELHTYLGIGKQNVRLIGSATYAGNLRVKRSAALNEFQLDAYGKLQMEYSDATIRSDSYTYLNEDFIYGGDYNISGNGADKTLTIESGKHLLAFGETQTDQMLVQGTSFVTMRLDDAVKINQIFVEEHATLIIQGTGSLEVGVLGNEPGKHGTIQIESGIVRADQLGSAEGGADISVTNPSDLTIGDCSGTLRGPDGRRLFPLLLVLETPDDYTLTLNAEETHTLTPQMNQLQLLLYEGNYAVELAKEPFLFHGSFTLTQAQTVYQSDLLLSLDCSLAPIQIGAQIVSCGSMQLASSADVCLTQSTATPEAITVTKTDAMIWVSDVSPIIQIYLPDAFTGAVRDKSGKPLRLVTIQTEFPNQEVLLHVDDQDYTLTTNEQGVFTFLATIGRHEFHFTIGETTYYPKQPSFIISSTENNYFSMDDLSDEEPKKEEDNKPELPDDNKEPDSDSDTDDSEKEEDKDENQAGSDTGTDSGNQNGTPAPTPDGSQGGTASGGSSSASGTGSGSSGSGGSSGWSGGFGGSSSAGGTTSSSGSSTGGNHINNINKTDAEKEHPETASGSAANTDTAKTEEDTANTSKPASPPNLQIKVSQKGIRLLPMTSKNKFTYYTKKPLTFTISREAGTTYKYKIVKKGQKAANVKWKTLTTDTLTFKADKKTQTGKYVIFCAVNAVGKVKQKTNGFVLDQTKPTITGVKHMRCYNKQKKLQITDSSGVSSVLLNGKKVKQTLTVKKRGVYILTATDRAGNKKKVIFAIW